MTNPLNLVFGHSNTKLKILEIVQETPLTLKEIQVQVTKNSKKPLTYQAIHKAITKLISDEVLERTPENKIQINKAWAEKLATLASQLKAIKSTKTSDAIKTKTFVFNNFVEFAKFTIRFFIETPNIENKAGICILNHSWPLFGMTKNDYELLKRLFSETTFYEIVKNQTPLDIAFSKIVQELGKKVKFDYYNSNCEIVVKGNTIFQAFYTKEFSRKFESIYKANQKKMTDTLMNDLIVNIMGEKTKITVLTFEDEEIANQIRDDVLMRFGKSP